MLRQLVHPEHALITRVEVQRDALRFPVGSEFVRILLLLLSHVRRVECIGIFTMLIFPFLDEELLLEHGFFFGPLVHIHLLDDLVTAIDRVEIESQCGTLLLPTIKFVNIFNADNLTRK